MRRSATLLAVAATATLSLQATPAPAAHNPKPSPSGAGFALSVVTGPDQVPNWSDQVTFEVTTTASTEPHVDLTCTQNGVTVLGATTGFYDSYPWPWTRVMTLSSNSWTSGAAECTAKLYYFNGRKTPVLATLAFHVDA